MAKHDEQVKTLQTIIETRREGQGVKPAAVLITNGLLKYNDRESTNIVTITDLDVLIRTYSFIVNAHNTYIDAASRLGITIDAPKISGYTLSEWEQDFKHLSRVLAWKTNDQQLKKLQANLDKLMSEDLRTETELTKIAKQLNLPVNN